jgi:hypothetical protein
LKRSVSTGKKEKKQEKKVGAIINSLAFSMKIYFIAAIISVAIMELVVFIRRIIRLKKGQ